MIRTFYKDHLKKSITTSPLLDTAPSMTRLTVNLPVKQKQGQPIRRVKKRTKWGNKEKTTKKRRQRRGHKEESESMQF